MRFIDTFRDQRTLHITHTDLDGIGALIIGTYYLTSLCSSYQIYSSDDYDCTFLDDKILSEFDKIIFTDFAPTVSFYLKLKSLGKDVYIFDHHISSYKELESFNVPNYYFSLEKCGTKIFLESLTQGIRVKPTVFQFVELVNCYDMYMDNSILWQDARTLNHILYSSKRYDITSYHGEEYHEFISKTLDKFHTAKRFYFSPKEQLIASKGVAKEKQAIQESKNTLQIRIDNQGNKYGYFECYSKLSYAALLLLKNNKDLKYVVGHPTFNDKEPKISIRTLEENDFDCSAVAKAHGGGGHVCAAGIMLSDIEFFEKLKKGEVHLI